MTEQNDNLDDTGEETKAKGTLKRLIIMVGAMLAVAALSVGATLFLTGGFDDTPEPQPLAEGEEAPPERPTQRGLYLALNPDFVVSYEVNSRQRFLRVEMAVRARDQEVLDTLTRHMPRVRNNVIQVLSDRTFQDIRTDEGREELTSVLRGIMDEIVENELGRMGVDAVLFTNFVLQ